MVAAASGTPAIGPNLTEPLLGARRDARRHLRLAAATGSCSALLAGSVIDRWYVQAFAVANWLTAGLLGTGAFGLVAGIGGLGILALAAWAISGQPRGAFDLLGAIAEFAEPLLEFWKQVTGPREAVRNPLLRELLRIADGVAGLVALLLGAAAVLITRVGPLLDPLRVGLLATMGLVRELGALIAFVVVQTAAFLRSLLSGPASVPRLLNVVLAGLARTFRRIGTSLQRAWTTIADEFSSFGAGAAGTLSMWWRALGSPFVRFHTLDHPTVAYLRSFIGQVAVAGQWRDRVAKEEAKKLEEEEKRTGKKPQPEPPGIMGQAADWVVGEIKRNMPAAKPVLPRIPGTPQLLSLRLIAPIADALAALPWLVPNPLALGTEATAVLRRAQRPPSVFAREWEALRAAAL